MASRVDPRGDLALPTIQHMSTLYSRSGLFAADIGNNNRRFSTLSLTSRPRKKPCHDWIFSSASNVHISIDRSVFKVYKEFDSYVLTLSSEREVTVEGVGIVELKIRRRPESKESHTITLANVLHVPSWPCNIFSDIHFGLGTEYEHTWTDFGVQFTKLEEGGKVEPWGYTEEFCSLDRLVLAKTHKDSRSPMLEDRDREVYSISVTWPPSQRDRWQELLAEQADQQPLRISLLPGSPGVKGISPVSKSAGIPAKAGSMAGMRAALSDVKASTVYRVPSRRTSSLKATASMQGLAKRLSQSLQA